MKHTKKAAIPTTTLQIVQGSTKVDSDGAVALKSSVNALTAGSATSADYGLEKAKTVFDTAGQCIDRP